MTNIFLSVFERSISVSLIVVMLILLAPFLNKRYAAKWKCWIWIFLALQLIIPLSGVDRNDGLTLLSQRKMQIPLESEKDYMETLSDEITLPQRVIVEIPVQMTTPIAVQSPKNGIHITVLDIVAMIWLIGSFVFIGIYLLSYLHYKNQIIKKGVAIEDNSILDKVQRLKNELHIKHSILLVESSQAASPMIIGFFQPILVLPREQYGSEELYFILKHELIHFKRRDIYFKLLFVAANVIHWFNPFIWIMKKEAAVDMELSCDERVVQGADYTVRKAYTETLLSALHKRYSKDTVFSTQFYGGKQIMKKRFKNILIKTGKKNGVILLTSVILFTISLGTLVGCSVSKDAIEKMSEQLEKKEDPFIPVEEKAMINLNWRKEEVYESEDTEQESAIVMTENGYSIYLPEGEWQQSNLEGWMREDFGVHSTEEEWQHCNIDVWTAIANKQVQIWIIPFKENSINQIGEKLAGDGYTFENDKGTKQKEEIVHKVKLNEIEGDVWGIFYCYPSEAEEEWGRELSVITDTFAVSK